MKEEKDNNWRLSGAAAAVEGMRGMQQRREMTNGLAVRQLARPNLEEANPKPLKSQHARLIRFAERCSCTYMELLLPCSDGYKGTLCSAVSVVGVK